MNGLAMDNHENKHVCPVELIRVETAVRRTEYNKIRDRLQQKNMHPTPTVVPTMFDEPETRRR